MIKYNFFGKECAIDKTSIDYSFAKKHLSNNGFKTLQLILVNQVHGNDVLVIENQSQIPQKLINADAIVTNLKNISIGILTADCVPILLFDEKNEVIAAVHAGWQGAFKKVTENAVDEMLKIGAKIENIKAAIGPCIRQSSYEVDENFYQRFLSENQDNKIFFISSKNQSHYMFDLALYIERKLADKGIGTVIDDGIDTYFDEKKYFSYRRNTHQKITDELRNLSVIEIS